LAFCYSGDAKIEGGLMDNSTEKNADGPAHPNSLSLDENLKRVILVELERILKSPPFRASGRSKQFLSYVVRNSLDGHGEYLKERTIGVEVFQRDQEYATGDDPVVRVNAGEVRRRLEQYYYAAPIDTPVRIEIPIGSYVPEFRWTSEAATQEEFPHAVEAQIADEPIDAAPGNPAVVQTRNPRRWIWLVTASGVIIVVALILGTRYWRQFEKQKPAPEEQKSALEEVWSPLLTSSKPILFCVGEYMFSTLPDSPLTQLQNGADEDSILQTSADKSDFVPFSDVQVLSRFVALAGTHGHAFKVQNSRATVSSQIREGPVVLIGALNNDWTLNRTSSLRFHLQGPEGPNRVYWIADTQHPESRKWQVSAMAPRSNLVKDYAIAARFTDESTGEVVLVAAGIAGSGTRAAGEFLTDEADLKQLADSAGADWAKKNFEVVLSSQVVNRMQGKPAVEAKAFW
jgi:hypothetical protein